MSDLALRVSNIGKRYELGQLGTASDFVRRTRALARRALGRGRTASHDADRPWDHETDPNAFWALRGVDFEVREGEVLGIIGGNGAGKSTLLKVLSRITAPTVGRIELFGRVASLLEVGTGFHPELTGRENVYLNGSILGMTRAEITKKFDEIVDFAGVERFIDTPVKRYSSGMKVRLGFAVAAHLEPEILIVDEVLAVGDAQFQAKCLSKMKDVSRAGRTVLFVSHNMGAIASLCGRSLFIQNGQLEGDGKSSDVIENYLECGSKNEQVDLTDWKVRRSGDGPSRIQHASVMRENFDLATRFKTGETIRFAIKVAGEIGSVCIIGISIRDSIGKLILHISNVDENIELEIKNKPTEFVVDIPDNILNNGKYYVTMWLGDSMNILNDRIGDCISFNINNDTERKVIGEAPVLVKSRWQHRLEEQIAECNI